MNKPRDRYEISPDAIAQEVAGETVIMDLRSETYFGLNATGTRIWQLLAQGEGSAVIISTLAAEYGQPEETIAADFLALIDALLADGLITVLEPSRT